MALRFLPAVLIAAAVALFMSPVLAGHGLFFGHDLALWSYYIDSYTQSQLRNFDFPLWNPHFFAGMPHYVTGGLFYPLRYLFLPFPIALGINLSLAVHLFLAGLFTYLFLRRLNVSVAAGLVGSFTAMFAGCETLRLYAGHITHLQARTWIPALLWAWQASRTERDLKWVPLGAFFLASMLTANHLQIAFYGMLAFAFVVICSCVQSLRHEGWSGAARDGLRAVAIGLLGVGLAAITLLPMLGWLPSSARNVASESFSLAPKDLITLVVPDFFGDDVRTPFRGGTYPWEANLHVGAVALALALSTPLRRRDGLVWTYGALLVGALFLVLGEHTPVHGLLERVVPGFHFFRAPTRASVLFVLAASVLAALALDGWAGKGSARRAWTWGFLCVIGVELFHFGWRYMRTIPVDELQPEAGMISTFRAERDPVRYLEQRSAAQANRGVLAGLANIGGFDPAVLRVFNEFGRSGVRESPDLYRPLVTFARPPDPQRFLRLLRLLNVRFLATRSAPPGNAADWEDTTALAPPAGRLFRLKETLPRAWVVHRSEIVLDRDSSLARVFAPDFDPRETVLLNDVEAPPIFGHSDNAEQVPRIDFHGPDALTIHVYAQSAAYLVLSEIYFPGWNATVDGRVASVFRANHLLRAIPVPAGRHEVILEFHPPGFVAGEAVSAVSLLLCVAALALSPRRKALIPSAMKRRNSG